MTTFTTEIKHVENHIEVLDRLGFKISLNNILIKEFGRELASDINNCL